MRASLEGVLDEGFVWAGQNVGLIHDVPSAQEIIERLVTEAHEMIRRVQSMFQE